MRIKQLAIATMMIGVLLTACTNTKPSGQTSEIEKFITNFFTQYPKATLQDVYKGAFQDYFGPAHLLTDRKAVRNYIEYELSKADTLGGEYYEPCGWKGRHLRVNLSVIADSLLPIEDFIDAFMASAQGEPALSQEWLDEWDMIQHTVKRLYPNLEHFATDSANIAQQLSEGKYVMHHSRAFNQYYHPHYRIIRKEFFEQSILPAIEGKISMPQDADK